MLEEYGKPRSALECLIVAAVLLGLAGALLAISKVTLQRWAESSASASAVADTRAVLSAEQNYSAANLGYFDELQHLCARGPECKGIGIPDYPTDEPDFLDRDLARRSPYAKDFMTREWVGRDRPPAPPEGASVTSVVDYCYRATPSRWLGPEAPSWIGIPTGVVAGNRGCPRTATPFGEPEPCPIRETYSFCQ